MRIPRWYLPFTAMLALESLRPAEDPLAGIDIEREYELIRQKRWELMYGGAKQHEIST